ncbi:DUF222 domain-containing protein [Amnibacterium sp. CER49]|uniref:HNH endonuclease signature motif containing protein n=1 Tax=Amnibacterium sp. CER49 TaxID=3039161 RepID=UPI00244A5A0E|nr:HNH endonuclease signature motif containing protein [Amnibacterium sp. CER49]MDH2444812.1 DUF222 domain-containing protein [Amnibacterium sp. CER49]
MEHGSPGEEQNQESPPGEGAQLFDRLNEGVSGAARAVHLAEALRAQAVLALWDAVVADEHERGMSTQPGGRAERAFAVHLAGLLSVSRGCAIRWLHTSLAMRDGLPCSFTAFLSGEFGWRSAESVVQNAGGLLGPSRAEYDERAAALAADTVPQRLDAALVRLHDALDPDEATERAASAFRSRRVSARPGPCGEGRLTLTGPETDIAAVYETARRAAVAAHRVEGEDRPIGVLMYDSLLDVVLHGLAVAPGELDLRGAAPTPADPFQRLGDPRVPQRKAISAEILVTVPAATATGIGNAPGRLAGWGSLAAAEVRRIVAAARFWTRVEVDPVDDAILAFDSAQRTIPTALRRLIQARSETCDEVAGCPVPALHCDIDHVIRVEHGGRTVAINLSALCRPGHQTKDDGYVDVERTADGGLVWRTRWGGRFVTRPATRIRPKPQADDQTRDAESEADEDDGVMPWHMAA